MSQDWLSLDSPGISETEKRPIKTLREITSGKGPIWEMNSLTLHDLLSLLQRTIKRLGLRHNNAFLCACSELRCNKYEL